MVARGNGIARNVDVYEEVLVDHWILGCLFEAIQGPDNDVCCNDVCELLVDQTLIDHG